MQRSDFAADLDGFHQFDVVIIGAGAVGGVVAKELVEAGLEVLMLEAGPAMTPSDVSDVTSWTPTRRHQAARTQPIQAQCAAYWSGNPNLFVDDFVNPYSVMASAPFTWIRGRQVGGRSLTWGGVTPRFSDYEFHDLDCDDVGPRWPITYETLAPFYDRVERLLGVCGSIERLREIPDGAFLPPVPFTAAETQFKARIEARWPSRRVMICRGVSPEVNQGIDDHGRWSPKSALHFALPAAFASGRLTVRANSVVSHLLVDASTARLNGAAVVDRVTDHSFEVHGRVIVLCASTIESVRILLNSRSHLHPAGVGNSSGLLGRGLVDHIAVRAAGPLAQGQKHRAFHPFGGPHSICMPRFRNLAREEHHKFRGGYGLWGGIGRGAQMEEQSWSLTAVLEVLSCDDNRIEIDETLQDAWGIKAVRVRLRYSENEWSMCEDAARELTEAASVGHLQITHRSISSPGQYAHELGGARMGSDPRQSVLSPFNQCWDASSIFVVDGSCFPTSGWQNPTLTMMALATRACDFIVTQIRSGAL